MKNTLQSSTFRETADDSSPLAGAPIWKEDFPELRLAAGEITAITGTNGAGKTSFLSCLCGLEKRCRGMSLSGGQKQRLAIACALASGRKIRLLDEPTSGLDYAHMMETAELLKQLKNLGATIFVVTHDNDLIRACCSRRLAFSAQGTNRNKQ